MAATDVTWLSEISFLRPFWLLALPLLLVLAVVSARRVARPGDWTKRIDPHLMAAMKALGRVRTTQRRLRCTLPFWAAGIIALALVGPAVERGTGETFRNLDGVIFVVDVSASMTQDEKWPAVVTMMRAGISVLGTKPAALIVFGGDSYIASPLTTDHLQLGQTVALLDDKTVPDKGSRPALALVQAVRVLQQSRILAGDVVLLTDGEGVGVDTLARAQDLAGLDSRLLVVVAETSVADPAAGLSAFDALVRAGNCVVFRLDQVEELMSELSASSEKRLEGQNLRLLFWTDYGRYFLIFALIPLAGLLRREGV